MELPDYRPRFPPRPLPRVAILGAAGIATTAHLPAYARYGVEVVGVWSRHPDRAAASARRFGVPRVYGSVDELLADELVEIVDIATPVAGRQQLVLDAVRAGKHVLAQKPFLDDPDDVAVVEREVRAHGVRVAVNQNARWAPAWRLATLLIADGAIGDVAAITHVHDKPLPPIAARPYDDPEHPLVTDYLQHWFDIARCWLRGHRVRAVTAEDGAVPGSPVDGRLPWRASARLDCDDGAHALLHIPAPSHTARGSAPFWVHGTAGTLSGSVLLGSDRLTLDRGETRTSFALAGEWFVDGFAGAMAELMSAVVEGREPENSATDNAATLRLVAAAAASARAGGERVEVGVGL